ncbi:ABC1 family-domain-containing protein [Scheffersomyces xylosifermentans]|uniref:ABC1 family-domain-containing protein n=1 Tax=Scheffersomyces xylosifermentans TaxID=1304137 RepID=UPI00315CC81A
MFRLSHIVSSTRSRNALTRLSGSSIPPSARLIHAPARSQLRFISTSKVALKIAPKVVPKVAGPISSQVGSKTVNKHSKLYRYVVRPVVVSLCVGGTIYLIDSYAYSSLLTRSVRALYILLWIAYAYGTNKEDNPEELHEVASESLLQLLIANKGLYIKIGQAIANQGNIFPLAYQKRFAQLYDDAPVDSWARVDAVLRNSLGSNYESEVFESISHEPVASASIAQVHKAVLKDSKETVAVKVQHDYIQKQVIVDLWVYRFTSKVYEKVFDIPLSYFTKYISDQEIKETDFIHEMGNADKLTEIIKNDPTMKNVNVYIPKNYGKYTTKQVLVTEWIDGISLTDKDRLLDAGFDLTLIMQQYLNVFGKQMFKYGLVHSDPHPGNLLSRFDSKGKQQLVILDHGLYVTLPESFCVEYCNLWRYLFSFNRKGIEDIAKNWGINSYEMFSTLVSLRPMSVDPRDSAELRDKTSFHSLFRDFLGDKTKFPLPFLFLTRTMRIIQNLNQSFGSPVNRINLLTKESVDALLINKNSKLNFSDRFELFTIRVNLFFSNVIFLFIRFRQIIMGDRYGGKGVGLEDYIEIYMQNTAKTLGLDWA